MFTLSTLSIILWAGGIFLLWWTVFVSDLLKNLMESNIPVVRFVGFYFACTIWYGYGRWLLTAKEHPDMTFQQYMGDAAITMLWVFGVLAVLWFLVSIGGAAGGSKSKRKPTEFGRWLDKADEDVLGMFQSGIITPDELKEFFLRYPRGGIMHVDMMLEDRKDSSSRRMKIVMKEFAEGYLNKLSEEDRKAVYAEIDTIYGGDKLKWRHAYYEKLGIMKKFRTPKKGAYDHIKAYEEPADAGENKA